MRKLRDKTVVVQEPILRQAPFTIDLVIAEYKQDPSMVKTISPEAIQQISGFYEEIKGQESEIKGKIAVLRDILLDYGRLHEVKKVGKLNFNDKALPPKVEPIKIAEFIMSQGYEKKQLHEVFNAVFSVSLTEFKKYFGEEALKRCGAVIEKKEFAEIRISKK